MDGLIEGRIVHFVMDDGPKQGEHRPAIVVKVWDRDYGTVNLQVFTDADNDGLQAHATPVMWKTSRAYSEDHEPGTWHWIERAQETSNG